MNKQIFLVTGAAGFIGYSVCKRLLSEGHTVVGIDNLSPYYSVQLKKMRAESLVPKRGLNFHFQVVDISNKDEVTKLFADWHFDRVINLAAQAGVRYCTENPSSYIQSNLVGFGNILDACHKSHVPHLLYASSSSVYGDNQKLPFSEKDMTEKQVSLYAATKKANESMAQSYASMFSLPCTGMRFFTVYGPWGRPDMAIYKFTQAISNDEVFYLYNNGEMYRDFTYIDDVVECIMRLSDIIPDNKVPHEIYNVGGDATVKITDMVSMLEEIIGKQGLKAFLPMMTGDMITTRADTEKLEEAIRYTPVVPLKIGLRNFVEWYKDFY